MIAEATTSSRSTSKTYKVDTDRRDVRLRVGVISESEQQTGLSDTGVSDKEQFEEVVAAEQAWRTEIKKKKKRNVGWKKR